MQITPEAFRQRFSSLRLDTAGTALLLAVLQPIDLVAGDKLLTEGRFSDTLYLVWSGRLLITVTSRDSNLTLGEVEPGGWVGDFGFIEPGAAVEDVAAKESTTVLALSQNGLKELSEQSGDTAIALLQTLSLELARRLRVTHIHYIEKSGEHEYALRIPPASERKGWIDMLRKLMGLERDER